MILYLHGFASSPGSQKAAFFRKRFRAQGIQLAVPDLAGGDFQRLTISGQLAAVERATGGQRVSLMGSSLGGYLAALYAARRPKVEKLVLMAPAFKFASRWKEYLGEQAVAEWKRTGLLKVYHYGERRTRQVGYQLLQDAAGYEDYPAVMQPTLIFHGRHDTVVPPKYSEEFAACTPQGRLEMLDSDHELVSVLEPMWEAAWRFLQTRP